MCVRITSVCIASILSGFGLANAGNRGVLKFGPHTAGGGWDSQPSPGQPPNFVC